MAGTKAGGIKAAKTNRSRYGSEFYKRLGALGGKKSRGGGFAANPLLASKAGKLGGLMSRKNDDNATPPDEFEIEQARKHLKDVY